MTKFNYQNKSFLQCILTTVFAQSDAGLD